jgi:hypothetical protein
VSAPARQRILPRVLALAALLAAAGVVVAVLGAAGGGGDASGPSGRASGHRAHPKGPSPVALPDLAPVRNATPRPDWRAHPGPVPILRYHEVGEPEPGTASPELVVTLADFRAQMDWLAAHGYQAVVLDAVEDGWSEGAPLPAKPVVLSFDGTGGQLLGSVVPELDRRGWPGELVLEAGARPLRAHAVARLLALGWGLEPSAGDPAAARRFARAHFPAPVDNFAFAQGESADSAGALEAAGFRGATVTGGGFAASTAPFDLPRITLFNATRARGLAELIRSHGEGAGA